MYCLPFSFSCLASSSYSLILPKRIDDVILVFTNECGKQKIKGKSHLKIEPLITKRIHLFTLFWASTKVIFIQCLLNWFEICCMDCGVNKTCISNLMFNGSLLKHIKHVHLYKWHAYFFEKDKNFGYKYNEVGFCFVVQ